MGLCDLGQHQVLPAQNLAPSGHTGQGGGDTQGYLSLTVGFPALGAVTVATTLGRGELCLGEMESADYAVQLLQR